MRITRDVPLSSRTTLRLGGPCQAEILLENRSDLDVLCAKLKEQDAPWTMLGLGSNILAADEAHALVLVRLAGGEAPEVVREWQGRVVVRVGAGIRLPRLLGWCALRGFSGLEGLAGIPGSVGGGVRMNAGSYGACMDDRLHRIEIWERCSGTQWLERGAWSAGYRSLELVAGTAQEWFAVQAEFLLGRGAPAEVGGRIRTTLARKRSTQPLSDWSCGCAFKNPNQVESAGRLLDAAGFRGKRLGGVGFSEMHANFLVHHGQGSAAQAHQLLDEAAQTVRERFGILLEPEVRFLP